MEILHWKEIETPEGLRPVLFFNPTLSFLTYLNNYGYHNIPVRVMDSIFYDGLYVTDVEVTTQMPGEKQYYSIVLNRDFTLMPIQKGSVMLSEIPHDAAYLKTTDTNAAAHPLMSSDKSNYQHMPTILTEHNDNTPNVLNHPSTPTTPMMPMTPTTSPTQICTSKSLDLWQIFLIILALIIIMICCFYPFLF